jgi:hypothetical protein
MLPFGSDEYVDGSRQTAESTAGRDYECWNDCMILREENGEEVS